jgi:hypothetical protein
VRAQPLVDRALDDISGVMGDKVKIVKLNVDESPKKPWAASAMKTRSQVHN